MTLADMIAADAANVAADPLYEQQFFAMPDNGFMLMLEALDAGFSMDEAIEYANA